MFEAEDFGEAFTRRDPGHRRSGELDTARDELTLSAVGPDFEEEGKTRNYRDVITFQDDDNLR